jgi:alkylation response protein AidB-like acyl-CoA dehydrogenase
VDFTFTADEEAFRTEIRSWLAENLPQEWVYKGIGVEQGVHSVGVMREWQRRLYDAGWLKLTWPAELGGRRASAVLKAIYDEEMLRAGAPPILGSIGVALLVPTLLTYGTDWQKESYIERTLSGELVFCQGFSEPNAGSDLAGLRSRAQRRDGRWYLSGQKIWSSQAAHSQYSFFLARIEPTDPVKPHRGIGFFLLDLRQPQVEIRPIQQMTGGDEFCELFATDAVVEERDVVPGDGWQIAMATFGFERGYRAHPERIRRAADALAELARARRLTADPLVRQRIAQAHIEAHVYRLNALRALTSMAKGRVPGPEMSLAKLGWSETDRRLQDTAMEVEGMYGALDPASECSLEGGRWQNAWMWGHAGTIYAGSSEIQRNIIAERVLGLPRSR